MAYRAEPPRLMVDDGPTSRASWPIISPGLVTAITPPVANLRSVATAPRFTVLDLMLLGMSGFDVLKERGDATRRRTSG
jgi:hypothetical protein